MSDAALPDSLRKHPRLGQWLQVSAQGGIRAFTGKVELGQGITHALRLIVAEELDLEPQQVEMVRPTTAHSPDEAVTSGSLSVQHSGATLRLAAAHLREACRDRAAQWCGVPRDSVVLEGGVFRAGTSRYTWAELVDAAMLDEPIDPAQAGSRPIGIPSHREQGRPDIEQKVFGEFTYLHDLSPAGMCRGQVFRPAVLQATMDDASWEALALRLRALPGIVKVVRDGLLLGVLAESAHALERSARIVAQADLWRGEVDVPAPDDVPRWLRSQPLETATLVDRRPEAPLPAATRVWQAEFGRGWLQHASIGLCCAIAQWTGGTLQVWSHTQGIFNLRRDLALAFRLPEDAVHVCHADGAGCYGHNGADDVAFDAAWLARHADGRPLRLEWTRQQEMASAPMGPAMAVAIEAAVDAQGRLQAWKQEVWSQGHGTRPGRDTTPALLGAWQVEPPFPITMAVNAAPHSGGGADRNATPPYAMPRLEVVNHRVLAMPLRVSALRSLGAHVNVLAAESMVDDIARSLGRDPLQYRLDHLPHDERARAVLAEVASLSGWGRPPGDRPEGWGRGIGFARYKNTGAWCAVVVDLVVEAEVRLRQLWIAADLGRVVHPDGARNQIEGGAIQAASWTLRESAHLSARGIVSSDWESYPILGFTEVPAVGIALVDRPDCPSLGAGECSIGPTAAAIGNAIRDALGLRARHMPFTADTLMRAVQAQDPD